MVKNELVSRLSKHVPFLITCFVFILLFLLGSPMYENGDDMLIIAILSGELGFVQSSDAVFLSPLLGCFISNLYSFNPGIPWYGLLLYALHFISFYLGAMLIFLIYKSVLDRLFCILVQISLYITLFYRISFTATSLFLWFTCILYLIYLSLADEKPRIQELIIGLLLILSFLLRPSIIMVVALAFSFPLLLSYIYKPKRRRFFYTLFPLTIILFFSFFYGDMIDSGIRNDSYYKELQSARSALSDTMQGLPGNNTEEALVAANWTEADYHLGRSFWTHDEEVYNPKRINTFININSPGALPTSLEILLISLHGNGTYIIVLLLSIFYLIGLQTDVKKYPLLILTKRQKPYTIVIAISIFLLIAGFLILASMRLPPRIANPILIYFFILFIVASPLFNSLNMYKKKGFRPKTKLFISLAVILYLTTFNLNQIRKDSTSFSIFKEFQAKAAQEIKYIAGDSAIFIPVVPNYYLAMAHPLKEFRDIETYKSVPGGWITGTSIYYDVLEKYGAVSGREFLQNAINNEQVIFTFLETSWHSFSQYGGYLEEHLNTHHVMPGHIIKFDVIYEEKLYESVRLLYFNVHTNQMDERREQL